jgi:hypothetical protein
MWAQLIAIVRATQCALKKANLKKYSSRRNLCLEKKKPQKTGHGSDLKGAFQRNRFAQNAQAKKQQIIIYA